MLTNKGLVEHVKMALNEKWGYVWGTFGDILTETLFQEKLKQYPKAVGYYKAFIKNNYIDKRTADCIGLIKSYMWWKNDNPQYDSNTDVSADGMFDIATEKGLINTIPQDIPGLLVYKTGHIGVYIGNGQVIESHGTQYGVIQTPLNGDNATDWTNWLKCPYITYEKEIVEKTYVDIINEVSDGSSKEWIKGIALATAMAKEDGNLGDLEIFKFLPELIVKIQKKYSQK